MKVLQLGKFYPPYMGGIETMMYDLTEGLNQRQTHTDVLCSNHKATYEEEHHDYAVFRTKSYGVRFSTSLTPQFITRYRQLHTQYDLIHIHLPNPVANLALFLSNTTAKIVLHWHSDIIKQKRLLKLYAPLQRWLLQRADAIITTSPSYLKGSTFLADFQQKAHVIPIGIRPQNLLANPQKVDAIKTQFAGKKIVFGVGRLAYYKGFKHLIDCAQHLDDSHVILIGGAGPLQQELQRQIIQLRLLHKVILLGRIPTPELGSYYQACDLFCMSSIERSEAFGVVQLEAMSFGKPLVSTRIPKSGVDWVNQHGTSGLTVPPADSKKLALAIQQITQTPSLHKKLSLGSKQRFEQLFTREKMVQSTQQLYQQLLHTP